MSATLPGLGPPASLQLEETVWGIDTSTLRMSAGALIPGSPQPEVRWDTLSLPKGATVAFRQSLALREMLPWLSRLRDEWGRPAVIGIEAPLAGGKTPLGSFYVVGALYCAIGSVFGVEVEVIEFNPGEWKKLATGHGYCPGLPKAMPKAQKRQAEKERMVRWAREAAGYTGWLDDEADGIGVVTATGIRVSLRTR